MPLIIGIENDETKFTDDEIEFISSLRFGILCQWAGLGRIEGVREFFDRIRITSLATEYLRRALPEWFDLELVKKMKAENWACNITRKTDDEWASDIMRALFDQICEEHGMKFGEDHTYSDRHRWTEYEWLPACLEDD